jgi:hypothetical protein
LLEAIINNHNSKAKTIRRAESVVEPPVPNAVRPPALVSHLGESENIATRN